MTRVSICLMVVLAGFVASAASAEDRPSSPYYEKYKILETWIGDWTNSGVIGGAEFKGRFSCRWAPGKSCLVWTWAVDGAVPELLEPRGYGIMGWDPIEGKIRELAYGENGLTYTTWFEVKGNSIHGTRETVLSNGEQFTETMVFTSYKDRIAIKNLDRRDAEGKQVPFLFPEESEFVRSPRPSTAQPEKVAAISAAPASAKESTHADFQKFCQAIQGRWVGDLTWVADWPGLGNKGEKVTAYWDGRVAEDGNVLVGKFFGGDGSETSLIYFDAAAKQIRWTMVSSGGSVTRSVVYRKDGKWNQKGHGSLLDGTKTHYTNNVTISDDGNTWTWQGSGTVGDKPTADQHDVWRRVSK